MAVTTEKLSTGKVSAVDRRITEALREGGVPKEALATAVAFVRELSSKGLKPTRGFPKGTPPFWDTLTVETTIAQNQLETLLPLLATRNLRGLKVLINGIPDPDVYHVQFDLGIPR